MAQKFDAGRLVIAGEPFPVADGYLTIPNRPGAGLEWNEDAVRRYAYDA